jgi:hypothetical protein
MSNEECDAWNATPGGPKYTCAWIEAGETCGKTQNRADRFRYHVQGHIGLKPYACADSTKIAPELKWCVLSYEFNFMLLTRSQVIVGFRVPQPEILMSRTRKRSLATGELTRVPIIVQAHSPHLSGIKVLPKNVARHRGKCSICSNPEATTSTGRSNT